MKKIISALSYYPVYFIIWLFNRFPLGFQYILADLIFLLIYYVVGYRKNIVLMNLRNSFPEKKEVEIRRIAKGFYRHLCDYFIESVALMNMDAQEIMRRFTYANIGLIDDLYRRGTSIILAVGHYNNWEWLAGMQLQVRHHMIAIYKPLNNKYYDRLFIRLREKFGAHTVPMAMALRYIIECDQKKMLTIPGFMTDQRPQEKYIEYWTRFLNQETPVQLGTEKIAKKMNYPVVFAHTRKLKRGYYETEFMLLAEYPRQTAEYEITEMHVRTLERIIREKPEYWLWSHHRWKHNRQLIEAKQIQKADHTKTLQEGLND